MNVSNCNVSTGGKNYDLEERTAKFGESVIIFCKAIKIDTISKPLISQIIRSGTSVGANYMEANGASSKKDFRNKIYICKKECQETKHWLRMIAVCFPENKEEIRKLWQEAQELTMIFQKIVNTAQKED
ncbi:MAG: four helix bundle protein [Candidatus Paceibacterota bacterium]